MSSEAWQDANSRYLAASLQWLRLSLAAQAPPPMPAPVPDKPQAAPVAASPERTPGLLNRLWGTDKAADGGAPPTILLPAPTETTLAEAEAEREAASRGDPPPALVLLAERFALSDFERDTLLLCAAAELDPALASLCSAIPGGGGRAYPTFGHALQLFPEPVWEALSPHRPLRYARLIELNQPGITPLTAAGLRADERIVNYIKGLNVIDERLGPLLTAASIEPARLAPSQEQVAEDIAAHLRLGAEQGQLPVVLLPGIDVGSKRDVAAQVCAGLGRRLYRLALDELPASRADQETIARLWQRESLLLPVALYIDAEDLDSAPREQAAALQWLLDRDLGPVFVGLRERPAWSTENGYGSEVHKPDAREQRAAWAEVLAAGGVEPAADAAALLAGQFDLNLRDIAAAAAEASLVDESSEPDPLPERLWQACCKLTRPRLDLLAHRLEPKATWDDLVLPAEALALLHQIAAQVRGRFRVYQDWGYAQKMTRGLGISALFAGESGTGKTMAAEVLANELGLTLYRIDLSAIVSKYIGETEKNLRKLFDAAEQGGAILFFDEADALFGKRSEVKDSHDRYANIEINYLLQRMEAFSGIAILATNMKSALDNAFMRRLRFIINFPYPGIAERQQMWQKALPPDVPREALDFERLARFNLSGGNIQSIAVNAAFAAATRDGAAQTVTMPLLLSATRSELRKLDKQVNEAEFRMIQTTKEKA